MPLQYDFRSLMTRLNEVAPIHQSSMASIFLAIDSQRRLAMYLDSLEPSLTREPECADVELRPVEFSWHPDRTAPRLARKIHGEPASTFLARGLSQVNFIATLIIATLRSPQFQSLARSTFKILGTWVTAKAASAGFNADDLNTILGLFLGVFGLGWSAVAHAPQPQPQLAPPAPVPAGA